ncbi:MAG: PAS domain S-box protein [Betaproteobacteria bacterium]|nr:MAG: PAS domain S-box protein [Betaproteobacteria bacterium]
MTTSNARTDAPLPPPFFLGRLAAGVVLLNLFVAVLAGFSIYQSRHQYQEQAEITTQNLAQVLENDIAGDFRNIDIALFAVLDEYQRQQATGRIDGTTLNGHIERVRARLPDIDALRITDAQGLLTYGSNVDRAARISLADRSHFLQLRDDPKAGLVFSQPQISRVNRKWVLVLARRIDQADGSFGGMVFAAISLEHISWMFSALNVGPRGIVTLRGTDLGIVVRQPEPKGIGSVIGQKTAPQPLREMVQAGRKSGTYLSLSTVDGIERTFTFRRVGDYPYLIITGLASDDYLTEWRNQTAKLTGLALLFALITLAGAGPVYLNWKRQRTSVVALAEQEAKFRTVADYTYDWEYWQGSQREILYMTPSCERVTGYTPQEFIADPALLLRIVHPEDRPAMDQHMLAIAQEDKSLLDFRIVRHDGEIRWISHHCHAIVGESGQPMGRRVSNRDITAGKQAEIALRQEMAFSATLIDSLPGIFYRLDAEARLVGWNNNLATLVGAAGLEKAQANTLHVIHDDDKEAIADKIREGFEKGYADAEARILLANGETRDFYFVGRSLVIGNQIYLLGTGVDISKRKAAEAALNEINETLEQRVIAAVHKNMEHERMLIQQSRLAAMGEMIGNIAHQWRQPLNALALLQANIKDAFEFGDLNRESMDQFSEDGQRLIQKMSTTIDDFRDYFKPNREKTPFPLHQAIDQALKIIGASFQNHNIAITLPANPEILVIGYPNEFSQVLLNVLNNAKEAMRERNVHGGKIDILLDHDSENAYVTIRDNGGGIPPQSLPKIFDPYYTTKDKGTGIGLYMSRMIMEHMDGSIEARNVGDGAEFRMMLPKAPLP